MTLDRGVIEQQLAALGEPATWWERRELRDLPAVLHADERIQAIALARLPRSLRMGRTTWVLVVTEGRLVCLQTDKRMGRRQFELQAGQITDLSVRSGIRKVRLIIRAYGEVYRMRVRRADSVRLIAAIARLVPTRERPTETRHSPGAMVGRVIQHMLALPAAALDEVKPSAPPVPPPTAEPFEHRLQLLEEEVQRLQQQVDFLEDLLQQRSLLGDPASKG